LIRLYIIHRFSRSNDSRKRKYFRWTAIYDVLVRTLRGALTEKGRAQEELYPKTEDLWPNARFIAYELARPPSFPPWDNGLWQIRIYTRLFTSDWKRSNIARATFYTPTFLPLFSGGDPPRYFYSCNSAQRLRKQRIRLLAVLLPRKKETMWWNYLGSRYIEVLSPHCH